MSRTREILMLVLSLEGAHGVPEKTPSVFSWAFGSPSLGLPVVVAGTELLVPIRPGGHTEALCAALLAEEQAWLLVCCRRTPPHTPP